MFYAILDLQQFYRNKGYFNTFCGCLDVTGVSANCYASKFASKLGKMPILI